MANAILNEIGLNDDIRDVIRKTNDNFKRVYHQATTQAVRTTIAKGESDIQKVVDSALGQIRVELSNALTDLEAAQKKIMDSIDDKIDELQKTLDSMSSSEAQNLVAMLAPLINGASVSGSRLVLPTGTKIATGDLNIIHGSRTIKTHTTSDSSDLIV